MMLRGARLILLLVCGGLLVSCSSGTQSPTQYSVLTLPPPAEDSKRLRGYLNLAKGYIQSGNYYRARQGLIKALEVDSKSAETHQLFGLLAYREGELEEADASYREALSIEPNNPKILLNYGSFLCETEKYREALVYFERVANMRDYPKRAVVFLSRGACAERNGDYGLAITSFKHAFRLNSSLHQAVLSLSSVYLRQSSLKLAKKYYDYYERKFQHTPRSLSLGIRLYKVLGNAEKVAQLQAMKK